MQAKIWNHSGWIQDTNPKKIKPLFDKLLRKSGFKCIGFNEHHFQPVGYTGLWLLAESHFAIHSFPEVGKSYIEISSCNLTFYQRFIELTKEL